MFVHSGDPLFWVHLYILLMVPPFGYVVICIFLSNIFCIRFAVMIFICVYVASQIFWINDEPLGLLPLGRMTNP